MKKSWILVFLLVFSLSSILAAQRTCTLDCADNSNDRVMVSNFFDSSSVKTCVIQDPQDSKYLYSTTCPSNPVNDSYPFVPFSSKICIFESQNTFSNQGYFLKYCPNSGFENRCPKWGSFGGDDCTLSTSIAVGAAYPSNCDNKTYVCYRPAGAPKAQWTQVDNCLTGEQYMILTGKRQTCSTSNVDESRGGWETPGPGCYAGCRYDNRGYDLVVYNDGGACRQNGVASNGVIDLNTCPLECGASPVWGSWSVCNATNQRTRICSGGTCAGGECVNGTVEVQYCHSLNKTIWSNLNSIGQIDQAQSGDTVLMVYGGQNLEGKTINYQVQNYTSGFVWYWPPSWFGSKVWSSSPKISGDAYEPWVVQGNQDGKLRFNATIDGTNIGNISNNLTINNTGSNPNSAPNATIIYPLNNCNYTINTPVIFNQTSEDEDDLLKIIWDFGDGSWNITNNYSKAINLKAADTTHNYASIGPKVVKLTAQDYRPSNSKSDTEQVNINIVKEGISVVPVISSPPNSSVHGNGSVYFNANQSYVLNCTSGNMLNPDFTTCDGLLNCSYIHRPGVIPSNTGHLYTLYLNWSFGDGRYNAGYWNQSSHLNLTSFTHTYLTASTHRINLNMKFNWTG